MQIDHRKIHNAKRIGESNRNRINYPDEIRCDCLLETSILASRFCSRTRVSESPL